MCRALANIFFCCWPKHNNNSSKCWTRWLIPRIHLLLFQCSIGFSLCRCMWMVIMMSDWKIQNTLGNGMRHIAYQAKQVTQTMSQLYYYFLQDIFVHNFFNFITTSSVHMLKSISIDKEKTAKIRFPLRTLNKRRKKKKRNSRISTKKKTFDPSFYGVFFSLL